MVEQSLNIRLKVNADDGSVVLDRFTGKLKEFEKTSKDINLIKWDAIADLGQKFLQVTERIYAFSRGVASSLNDIERQSKIIGVSTDQWQKWTYAANMSDVSTDALMTSMKFLSQNIMESKTAGSEVDRIFKALGITGGTLEETMYQLADVFSRAEDGERKIAIATKLMGRSAMEIIPYFNQGRQAIKEIGDEGERYNRIIGKDLIEAGSRADKSFKEFGASLEALKAKTAPWIEDFTGIIEKIVKLMNLAERIGKGENIPEAISKTIGNRKAWLEARMNLGLLQPEEFEELIKLRRPEIAVTPVTPKGKLADILGKETRGVLTREEQRDLWVKSEIERYAKVEAENDKFVEDQIKEYQDMAEGIITAYAKVDEENTKFIEDEKRRQEELRVKLIEMQNLVRDFGWEDYAAGATDASNEVTRAITRMSIKANNQLKETQSMGETFAERVGEAWNFNIKGIISDSENMGDALKKVFLGMGDAFTSAISRMISDWMLFGSVTGKTEKGKPMGGIIGWLGGLLPFAEGGIVSGWKPLHAFQEGGLISRPTLGLIGEGGPKAVIPLRGGKIPIEGGGKTIVNAFYIYANDPISFRDFVRRNPEAIIEAVYNNARTAGPMSKLGL